MSETTWQDQWQTAIMPTYGTPQLELVKGSGAIVTDSEGKDYLDLDLGVQKPKPDEPTPPIEKPEKGSSSETLDRCVARSMRRTVVSRSSARTRTSSASAPSPLASSA